MTNYAFLFLRAGVLMSLAGCTSSLEIGVDVYNGPLVNQDEVQTQQLIGVVYGTHQLLKQLDREIARKQMNAKDCTQCTAFQELIADALGTYDRDEVFGNIQELNSCAQSMQYLSDRIGTTSDSVVAFFSSLTKHKPEIIGKAVPAPKNFAGDLVLTKYQANRSGFFSSLEKAGPPRITDSDAAFVTKKLKRMDTELKDLSNDVVSLAAIRSTPEHRLSTLFDWAGEYQNYFDSTWKVHSALMYSRLPSFFVALEATPNFLTFTPNPQTQEGYDRAKDAVKFQLTSVVNATAEIYEEYQHYDSLKEELRATLNRLREEALARKLEEKTCESNASPTRSKGHPWNEADIIQALYYLDRMPTPVQLASDDPPDWRDAQGKLKRVLEASDRLNNVGTPARGKNYRGLDQLMRSYVSARGGVDRIRARRELLLELTRFGEKLRMLGTYNKAIVDTHERFQVNLSARDESGMPSTRSSGVSVTIQQTLFLLEAIGNNLVAAADGAFTRERKMITAIVKLFEAAEAMKTMSTPNLSPSCIQVQFERLAMAVASIRRGEVPYDLLAMTELNDDPSGLFAIATRLEIELVDLLKSNDGTNNKVKIASYRDALQEVLELRSNTSDISPARDFLRTVDSGPLRKSDGRIVRSSEARRDDDELVRQMVEVVERQMWRNINTIDVRASGKADYVVVKDAIGNWYIKSYSNDPSELIAAAFGGIKAVAEFALAAQSGGTSEAMKAFLTEVVKGNAGGGNSDTFKRQLDNAWTTYSQAKLDALTKAHKAIIAGKPNLDDKNAGPVLEKVFKENPVPASTPTTKADDLIQQSVDEMKKLDALLKSFDDAKAQFSALPTKPGEEDPAKKDRSALDAARQNAKASVIDAINSSKESLKLYLAVLKSIGAGVQQSTASTPSLSNTQPAAASLLPK